MRKTTLLFISMLTAIGFDLDAQSQGGVTVQFFTPGSVRILKEVPVILRSRAITSRLSSRLSLRPDWPRSGSKAL